MRIMDILTVKEPELNSKLDLRRDGKYPLGITLSLHRSVDHLPKMEVNHA